jgi:hypothetical protein
VLRSFSFYFSPGALITIHTTTIITTAIILPTLILTHRSTLIILHITHTDITAIIHIGIIITLTGINTHTGITIPISVIIEAIKAQGKDVIILREAAVAPLKDGLHHGRGATATERFGPDRRLRGKDVGNPEPPCNAAT